MFSYCTLNFFCCNKNYSDFIEILAVKFLFNSTFKVKSVNAYL